jgi:hypothetical protein
MQDSIDKGDGEGTVTAFDKMMRLVDKFAGSQPTKKPASSVAAAKSTAASAG